MHRSLACVRREPGERASGTCSPCAAAPAPLAYSCIAGLPLLFLWASKSDVTHFAPPSNPRPRLQTLPSAFGLLLHRRPASSLLMGFQKRRYAFCTAFKPSPATSNPSQRLWPTPASQPCLRQPGAPQRLWPTPASQTCLFSSYGLPKATLGILRRLQTLPRGFKPFPAPLAYSCIAALPAPAGSLGREPLERAARALQPQRLWPTPASQACLFSSYGRPKATLGILHRLQTLPRGFKPSAAPSNPPQRLWAYSCTAALPSSRQQACLFSSYGLPKATLDILDCLQTLPSAFKPSAAPSNPRQRLWPTPAPQRCPLLGSRPALRSVQTLPSAKPSGTVHCSLRTDLWNLPPRPAPRFFGVLQAPSNPSRHLWPSPATQPGAAPVCPVVAWLPDDWSILYFFVSCLRS